MIKERNFMRGEMDRRLIYRSKEFLDKMIERYDIEEAIKPKWRPKKGLIEVHYKYFIIGYKNNVPEKRKGICSVQNRSLHR